MGSESSLKLDTEESGDEESGDGEFGDENEDEHEGAQRTDATDLTKQMVADLSHHLTEKSEEFDIGLVSRYSNPDFVAYLTLHLLQQRHILKPHITTRISPTWSRGPLSFRKVGSCMISTAHPALFNELWYGC